jgi:hypothetical protein
MCYFACENSESQTAQNNILYNGHGCRLNQLSTIDGLRLETARAIISTHGLAGADLLRLAANSINAESFAGYGSVCLEDFSNGLARYQARATELCKL